MDLPLEVYDILERKLGRDDAMAVAKSIQVSLGHMADRGKELATKEDIAKIGERFERMDKKFTLLFAVTIFAVVFLNQSALEFLARLLGLLK